MSAEPNRKVSKASLEANEVLKSQIEASIGVARSLVESWLPAPKAGEKLEDDEEDAETLNRYSTGRPDRLGLGAKFLSHNEATKHQTQSLSKQEMHLRNKILNQNQKGNAAGRGGPATSKRPREDAASSDDDDEEDSKIRSVARRLDTKQSPSMSPAPKQQGDFLSMMMSERADKSKKKKKKKKGKGNATNSEQQQQQQEQKEDNP